MRKGLLRSAVAGAGIIVALAGCSVGQGVQGTGSSAAKIPAGMVMVPKVDQPSTYLDPAQFAAKVAQPGVVTINVHTPDQGRIPGTDLMIPYNEIRNMTSELPANKATPLAVYCRSGTMSAMAVRELSEFGYTHLYELAGGFNAWLASGRKMLPK